jgi:hypothetical protein
MFNHAGTILFDFKEDNIPWEHGKALYRLWKQEKADKNWPSRKQLSPRDMCAYLPDIMLIDVKRDPLDFVVRLSGTGFHRFIPEDPTGQSVYTFNNGEQICARFAKALETKAPYLGLNQPTPWPDTMYEYKRFNGIVLPLGEDQEDISMLMLLVDYHA